MCNFYVCLRAYLKNHLAEFYQMFCACCRVLAALEYVMYTSGSVDDIMFSLNGPSGGMSHCTSIVLLLQQPSCSAVHRLIPLLHGTGCVLS